MNKNGGPDRRFSNNRQIPIAQYGLLEITSRTGLNIHFHVSNLESARYFAGGFNRALPTAHWKQTDGRQKGGPGAGRGRAARVGDGARSAYEILGVSARATHTEVVAAYGQMAMMYYPDRLSGLAPEFVELAEERMKEINAASEELKRRVTAV